MMLLIMLVLALPICSIPTALIVWLLHRDEQAEDSKLIRDFVVFLCLFVFAFWQVTKSHSVRMRLDPEYRIQVQIEANPVYQSLKGMESEASTLNAKLSDAMHKGKSIQDALLLARPWLRNEITHYSGFADQKTRLKWARLYVDTLKELQNINSMSCYQEIGQRDLDEEILMRGFSNENTQAFQQAVVDIHRSAIRGMGHDYPKDERPADFNATALENNTINKDIEEKFGADIVDIIRRHHFSDPEPNAPQRICAARIYQLESMLERPQATAALLVDSALRYR
jgi:hypothetical protein